MSDVVCLETMLHALAVKDDENARQLIGKLTKSVCEAVEDLDDKYLVWLSHQTLNVDPGTPKVSTEVGLSLLLALTQNKVDVELFMPFYQFLGHLLDDETDPVAHRRFLSSESLVTLAKLLDSLSEKLCQENVCEGLNDRLLQECSAKVFNLALKLSAETKQGEFEDAKINSRAAGACYSFVSSLMKCRGISLTDNGIPNNQLLPILLVAEALSGRDNADKAFVKASVRKLKEEVSIDENDRALKMIIPLEFEVLAMQGDSVDEEQLLKLLNRAKGCDAIGAAEFEHCGNVAVAAKLNPELTFLAFSSALELLLPLRPLETESVGRLLTKSLEAAPGKSKGLVSKAIELAAAENIKIPFQECFHSAYNHARVAFEQRHDYVAAESWLSISMRLAKLCPQFSASIHSDLQSTFDKVLMATALPFV